MSLIDRFGREIGNVRISLTDRCNLRCQYCMPEEGIDWVDRNEILSYEEILQLITVFYNQGVRKYRLTGGEPLIRREVPTLVKMIKDKYPDIELSMTTNGIKLSEFAQELHDNGLDRVNISLDTLDHQQFVNITRRDSFYKVMAGIQEAIDVGFEKIKINAVSIKSVNDDIDTLLEFVEFSDKYNLEVRFIEIMPFTGNHWEDGGFISSSELRDRLNRRRSLVPLPLENEASTSRIWKVEGTNAKIGFISSVTESFCDNCNRLRITAEGKLRPCLHNAKEYNLKQPLRSGATENELLNVISKGLQEKWKQHPNFLALTYSSPVDDREMIKIGG